MISTNTTEKYFVSQNTVTDTPACTAVRKAAKHAQAQKQKKRLHQVCLWIQKHASIILSILRYSIGGCDSGHHKNSNSPHTCRLFGVLARWTQALHKLYTRLTQGWHKLDTPSPLLVFRLRPEGGAPAKDAGTITFRTMTRTIQSTVLLSIIVLHCNDRDIIWPLPW